MLRNAATAATVFLLAACGGTPDLDDYADAEPELELEQYFDGAVVAHGIFQDLFGDIRRSFLVDIEGAWDGEALTLDERFRYEDGSTERRVWRLTKTGEETWSGNAHGVVGVANGVESGNAFNFAYTIDLETADGPFRVTIDDWMWQLDDRVMVNRGYVSKYGVRIGEISIFFRRETPLGS